jgi:hypothetical protein
VPEKLIAGSPEAFMRQILFGLNTGQVHYDPLALSVYFTSATRPESIVAMCECFSGPGSTSIVSTTRTIERRDGNSLSDIDRLG